MLMNARPSQLAERPERLHLLGVCVDRVTMEGTLRLAESFVAEGGPHHVVTLDAAMCVMARTDELLRQIIFAADLVTPDSAGVLWAARRMGKPLPERVPGVEIVPAMAGLAAQHGWRMFLLGAAQGVAERAGRNLESQYPGCTVTGVHHGYFTEAEEDAVVASIRAAAPHVLCVAMGIPKQEKWIHRHREELGVPVMIGVGGTLDVLSGAVPRAPRWMQRRGLEWAYRVLRNPRKLVKVLALPRFVTLVLREGRSR